MPSAWAAATAPIAARVLATKIAVGREIVGQQLGGGAVAARLVERGRHDPVAGNGDSPVAELGAVTGRATPRGVGVRRAGDVGDGAMAEVGEVAGRHARRAGVVDGHTRSHAGLVAVDEQARRTLGDSFPIEGLARGDRVQEPVDAPLEQSQPLEQAAHHDQQDVAVTGALRLGAAADLGIGRVRKVGYDDPERHRRRRSQRPGRAVGAILEAFDGVEHPLARLGLDRQTIVPAQDSRHDRRVDSRRCRDVADANRLRSRCHGVSLSQHAGPRVRCDRRPPCRVPAMFRPRSAVRRRRTRRAHRGRARSPGPADSGGPACRSRARARRARARGGAATQPPRGARTRRTEGAG